MTGKSLLGSVLCLGLFATPALAQDTTAPKHTAGINKVQRQQAARIKDGLRDGTITRAEFRRLRAAEGAIRAKANAFRQSGDSFTRAELRELRMDLKRASKRIYRAKHNGR